MPKEILRTGGLRRTCKFKEKGKAYVDQFNKYEPLPGVFVQGEFTLGENIGDLGGLAMAYDGLQLFYKENGKPGVIDGFTPEQRFFISWGTIWRTKFEMTLRTRYLPIHILHQCIAQMVR